MPPPDTRHVKARRNADGRVRHYWARPGFRARRLTGGDAERARQAAAWNARAEAGEAPRARSRPRRRRKDPRAIAYWIEAWRASPDWTRLAAQTRRAFAREADALHDALGGHRVDEVTRRVVKRWIALRPRSMRSHALCVVRAVLEAAADAGLIEANPAARIRVEASRPRRAVWSEADVAAFLAAGPAACPAQWPAVRLGVLLLLYTGQRVGDVLALRWQDFDGEYLRVAQAKTGAEVHVYCHRALRAELAAARPELPRGPIVAARHGRRYAYDGFYGLFSKVRARAGLGHLVLHDLRRTAVARLLEAGVDLAAVCQVTGHSPQSIRTIWRHYVTHQRAVTRAAIVRLEDHQRNVARGTSGNAG